MHEKFPSLLLDLPPFAPYTDAWQHTHTHTHIHVVCKLNPKSMTNYIITQTQTKMDKYQPPAARIHALYVQFGDG